MPVRTVVGIIITNAGIMVSIDVHEVIPITVVPDISGFMVVFFTSTIAIVATETGRQGFSSPFILVSLTHIGAHTTLNTVVTIISVTKDTGSLMVTHTMTTGFLAIAITHTITTAIIGTTVTNK